MNATPENFKPGERWLMDGSPFPIEVVCVEWSPSNEWVKMLIVSNDKASWFRATELIEQSNTLTGGRNLYQMPTIKLLERLPDVESGNYKTESESRLEAVGREWPCTCDHCAKVKAAIKEAERGEWAGKAADFFAECCGCEECKKKLEANAETKA